MDSNNDGNQENYNFGFDDDDDEDNDNNNQGNNQMYNNNFYQNDNINNNHYNNNNFNNNQNNYNNNYNNNNQNNNNYNNYNNNYNNNNQNNNNNFNNNQNNNYNNNYINNQNNNNYNNNNYNNNYNNNNQSNNYNNNYNNNFNNNNIKNSQMNVKQNNNNQYNNQINVHQSNNNNQINNNFNNYNGRQNNFNNNMNNNTNNNNNNMNNNMNNMNNNQNKNNYNNYNNQNNNQYNMNNTYNNNNNMNNQNNNFNNQNNPHAKKKDSKPVNPEKEKLKNAYNLFMLGMKDYKGLNLEIALDRFEKVKGIIDEVYPKIEKDKKLKETTDNFLNQVKQYITTTENRIKTKYTFTPTYNYSGKITDPKTEVAKFLKETQMASQRKKVNYFINDKKPKYKDTPSMYINEARNNNINNMNNMNNNNLPNKKDEKKIITNDLREKVLSEIVENKPDVKFSDVVGLKEAKEILREIIIVPNLRPDLFKGLRSPPRGLLLFGPPGTGKTMIAKAVATECKCTFFNISASSLTSKYLGESEKLVRTLFELAHEMQPSVVFIDEIESILSKRKEDENDAMKRLKTEFLIQFDGVGSGEDLRVLIIGATNRPFDLDPAIIRRLPKRIYVGPFNAQERKGFIKTIITQNKCNINDDEFLKIAELCNNYSNSDLKELCREAAYEPLRELNVKSLEKVEELRPIVYEDFIKAVRKVRGTLTKKILKELQDWNNEFGALSTKIN